jgi:aryl-alcohol dehydrogenase-like predicted oxidoreductase
MAFFEAVKASGPLDRHRILSKTAGVRVSPLCLGAMSLGKTWSSLLSGGIDEAQSFELLDYFYKNGGNFIDTAGNYQDDESEMIIGEWMKSRGNREDIVLATKFTSTHKFKGKDGVEIPVNYGGNHKKSLRNCLASSLKKMQTEYVDILYLHWWDWSTSIEELMQSLHQVVQSGKVLYLGISDTPAWIVSSANAYARAHSLTPFSIYQGKWNVLERDFDRDILPMCRHEGMAIAPWSVLCAGRLRTEEQIAERIKERGPLRGDKQSEAEAQMSKTLDDMGKKELNGASIAQIAIGGCEEL